MAAYGRVYDSRHLQDDCQEPGSAPEPYTLVNRAWATFGRLKTQVRKKKVPADGICKYGIRKYEYAGWKMQVWKTQVRICNGGKRKYSNLKSILKSLRFSSLAFSVDLLSVGLDQFTCTVPDRCRVTALGKQFTPIVPLFIKQRNW